MEKKSRSKREISVKCIYDGDLTFNQIIHETLYMFLMNELQIIEN